MPKHMLICPAMCLYISFLLVDLGPSIDHLKKMIFGANKTIPKPVFKASMYTVKGSCKSGFLTLGPA